MNLGMAPTSWRCPGAFGLKSERVSRGRSERVGLPAPGTSADGPLWLWLVAYRASVITLAVFSGSRVGHLSEGCSGGLRAGPLLSYQNLVAATIAPPLLLVGTADEGLAIKP